METPIPIQHWWFLACVRLGHNRTSTILQYEHSWLCHDVVTLEQCEIHSSNSSFMLPTHNSFSVPNDDVLKSGPKDPASSPSSLLSWDLDAGRNGWIFDTGADALTANDTAWSTDLNLFAYSVSPAGDQGIRQTKGREPSVCS